jgi:hypothetical protein
MKLFLSIAGMLENELRKESSLIQMAFSKVPQI